MGGLILYRINFDSPVQIKKLIADLEEALGRKLLVTTDHEGGRVIMFRDGITVFRTIWPWEAPAKSTMPGSRARSRPKNCADWGWT